MFNWNTFRTHISGRGFSGSEISTLWKLYKDAKITDEDLDNNLVLKQFLVEIPKKILLKTSHQPEIKPKIEISSSNLSGDIFGSKKMSLDMIKYTMRYLPLKSIMSWCSTNKYFAKEVCTDEFWREYVYNKYTINIKLAGETWKEAAKRYNITYDLYLLGDPKKRIKIRQSKPDTNYTGKYRKIIYNSFSGIKYYLSDDFKLYESWHQTSVICTDVVDFYELYEIYRAFIVIKKDGLVYYHTGYGDIDLIQIKFNDFKVVRIVHNYLISDKGNIKLFKFNDTKLIFEDVPVPVPVVYVTAYNNGFSNI